MNVPHLQELMSRRGHANGRSARPALVACRPSGPTPPLQNCSVPARTSRSSPCASSSACCRRPPSASRPAVGTEPPDEHRTELINLFTRIRQNIAYLFIGFINKSQTHTLYCLCMAKVLIKLNFDIHTTVTY